MEERGGMGRKEVFGMNKIKVYLDTSVISYLDQRDAPEKMQETREVWECLKSGEYDIYISDVVLDEIGHCKEDKQKVLLSYLQQIKHTIVPIDENTVGLAEKFIDFGVLKRKSFDDCRHIACAIPVFDTKKTKKSQKASKYAGGCKKSCVYEI